MTTRSHIPVLLREVVETLAPAPGETVVDCTAGLGGHAAALAEHIGPEGTIVLFDLDPGNLAHSRERIAGLPDAPRVIAHHASFADAARLLAKDSLAADVLLADLGFASPQVDDPARGLSFSKDGPLDMRLNPASPITAGELVNTLPERELASLIAELGEESWPDAKRIASKIAQSRGERPISTTTQLAGVISGALPAHGRSRIHPATKTFQALRIAVNDELGSLRVLLAAIERSAGAIARSATRSGLSGGDSGVGSPTFLRAGARVGIISFHSLEDRPVKQAFAGMVERGLVSELTRKPVVAGEEELGANPRSRSAKFRAIRIG